MRRPGIDPREVHVGFVMVKMALEQILLRVLRFRLTITVLQMLHIHAHLIYDRRHAGYPHNFT